MAEQFLSDFTAPSINGNVARRVLANEALRGVAQGAIETNGRGVTQRFSNDTTGAQIRIVQFMPFNLEARELGASLNGENFDTNTALQGMTNGLGVDVITVINRNIDIPQVTQDMLPIDLLGQYTYNLQMSINNNINAMTTAGKFVASMNDAVAGGDEIIVIDPTQEPEALKYDLILGNTKLNDGSPSAGLSYFPENDRIYVFKSTFVPFLFQSGVIIAGGSNYAQDILAQGGVSVGANPRLNDGYIGQFMGVPVHMMTTTVWNLAAKYAGINAWQFDDVYGYVSSGYANVRAIAQQDTMKIIDSPDGAGIRIQPNFRMGFKALYPEGTYWFVYANFVNPAETAPLTLKAPGARTAYSSDTTLASVSFAGQAGSFANNYWTVNVANATSEGTFSNVVATAGALAKVTYPTGTETVAVGNNNFYIKVEAQDGTTSKVRVLVVRAAE